MIEDKKNKKKSVNQNQYDIFRGPCPRL